jgi:hypothetical protein
MGFSAFTAHAKPTAHSRTPAAFVTIARCTIRLRQVDAADGDRFHDATSSNSLLHRFS